MTSSSMYAAPLLRTTTMERNAFFEDVFLIWAAPAISRDIGFKLWFHEYLVKS